MSDSSNPTSGSPADPIRPDATYGDPTGPHTPRPDATLPDEPLPEGTVPDAPSVDAGPTTAPAYAPGPTTAPAAAPAPTQTVRRGPTWELVTIGTLALLFAGWLIVAQVYQITIDLRAYSTLGTVGLGLVLLLLGLIGVTRRSQPPR